MIYNDSFCQQPGDNPKEILNRHDFKGIKPYNLKESFCLVLPYKETNVNSILFYHFLYYFLQKKKLSFSLLSSSFFFIIFFVSLFSCPLI